MEGRIRKKITPRNRIPMLLSVPALILAVLFVGYPASADNGGKNLKAGKSDLDSGHYEEAVRELAAAREDFPLLSDYALFYLSDAYRKLGEHRKSLDTVRALIEKYPDSPLIRRARAAEAREAGEIPGENPLKLYEAYVKDYPADAEASMTYAALLKQAGETSKAAVVFKRVYVAAGPLSKQALAELDAKAISAEEIIERASNLIGKCEYREAERELRKALAADEGKNRDEILRNLGLALFRQKQYREAAAVYEKISDQYFRARSLYRAGDKEGFSSVLNDLLAGNDKRAGELLLAVAADRRRDRDFDGAMKLYATVLDRYPLDTEDALWGTGWTYYAAADYRKSAETFSKLYAKFGDPRYLYWKARSLEALGQDAKELYHSLSKVDNSYYSALALARTKGTPASIGSQSKEPAFEPPSDRRHRAERVEALLSLGMTQEAVGELACLTKKIDSAEGLNYIIARFLQMGEYRRAIGLATKTRYTEKLHRFWYPPAYWDDVEAISKKQGIDPCILLAVMREESRFDAGARSVAGALGLMQIMPNTAFRLDKNLKLGIRRESQINDARNNIALGAFYLKSLLGEFGSLAHVLSAYNAGEAITRKWEQQGNYKSDDEFVEDIPYAETRNYVKKVINSYFQYRRSSVSDSSAPNLDIILGKL